MRRIAKEMVEFRGTHHSIDIVHEDRNREVVLASWFVILDTRYARYFFYWSCPLYLLLIYVTI
jgi:hypothetical protein